MDFGDFFQQLLKAASTEAATTFKSFAKDARADAKAFLESFKDDLERWMLLLAEKKITEDELAMLVEGQKSLTLFAALEKKGVARLRLEQLGDTLLHLAINTAITAATK